MTNSVRLDAYIVGTGLSRFGRREETPAQLAVEVIREALADAELGWSDIDAVMVGTVLVHPGAGQRMLLDTPLAGKPIANLENACASSGVAAREALAWLGAGFAATVLVLGVESMTSDREALRMPTEDVGGYLGASAMSTYALKASRRIQNGGLTLEQLASVTVKSRRQAAHNPLASFRKPTSIEEVLGDPMIVAPLTRSQCCPTADGAAALIMTTADVRARRSLPSSRIIASGMVSGRRRDDANSVWDATRRASALAYEQAGLGPADVDVAEVHDAFTMGEIVHYEDLGFCGAGEGGSYAESGASSLGGAGVAVNPTGGLLSRGHPLGASGATQLVELHRQLLNRAGPLQVENARIGLAHIMGGNVTEIDSNACTVHILESVVA